MSPAPVLFFNMNQTERIKSQELRRIIYELRQRWGVPADLYKVTAGEPDLETGDSGTTIQKIVVPQLVSGGFSFMRKFQYSISYIRANSNFGYGGFFEIGDIFAIVDCGLTIEQKDYLVVNNKKYNMQEIILLCDGIYMLHARQTTGETFGQIYDVYVRSQLNVEQEIDYGI